MLSLSKGENTMKKKLIIISILAVAILMILSFSSAVSSNISKTAKKKESPLYGIRTRRAIRERIRNLIENIKTKFLGDRIFFVPFQWIRNKINDDSIISRFCITCKANPCTLILKYCHTICMPFCDYTA